VFYHGHIAQLTEHDDVIKPLLRGAPRLGLALGPAPERAGPENIQLENLLNFKNVRPWPLKNSPIGRVPQFKKPSFK